MGSCVDVDGAAARLGPISRLRLDLSLTPADTHLDRLVREVNAALADLLPGLAASAALRAGTWDSFPVMVVSPFGLPGAFPVAEIGSLVGSGGGTTAHILVSSTAGAWTPLDAAFWFIAVES